MKSGFQQKYACTMIDIHTAIGMALGKKNPDAETTIRALAIWCSHYGTPQITVSDQGSHFMAAKVKKKTWQMIIHTVEFSFTTQLHCSRQY